MIEKRILTDFNGFTKFSLNESAGSLTTIEGEFGKADAPTANGRIYPRKLWEREIEKIRDDMKDGKVFSHLNHPSNGKTDLKEVAMVMKELWMENDGRIMGRATICDNQHGDQFKSIVKAGGKVGVSSRGMGSTRMGEGKYAGHEVVDEDYEYMTHDLVADPAVRTSYPDVKLEDDNKQANLTESPQEIVEPVVGKEGEVVKTYTEEELQAKLAEKEKEMKEAFEKLAEAKEEVSEIPVETPAEEKEEHEAMEKAVELAKEIQDVITPIVDKEEPKEDEKDEVIKELKSQIESKDKEIASMIIEAKQLAESTKRIAMGLTLERALASCIKSEDRKMLSTAVGDIKKHTMESLSGAIATGKKLIAEAKLIKLSEEKKLKQLQEQHDKKIAKLELELKEKNKKIEEGLISQNKKAAQLYVESVTRGNPNAQKIRKICEDKTDKREIDAIVKEYAIASADAGDYNYIQNRISRLDEAKKVSATLVEDQLGKAAGTTKKIQTEDVDSEIAQVGGM